jgi:hypothetical protein
VAFPFCFYNLLEKEEEMELKDYMENVIENNEKILNLFPDEQFSEAKKDVRETFKDGLRLMVNNHEYYESIKSQLEVIIGKSVHHGDMNGLLGIITIMMIHKGIDPSNPSKLMSETTLFLREQTGVEACVTGSHKEDLENILNKMVERSIK